MPRNQNQLLERQKIQTKEPPKYDVYIHNDDFTPMDFVVMILKQIFFKPTSEATALMLMVHHSDKAKVGTYSYDIASSKVERASTLSRENGFPLHLSISPSDQN